MAILHESDEGTMHEVRKIAVGGRRGTECNLDRQNEYSFHMEVRTLYARRMFREQDSVSCGFLSVSGELGAHQEWGNLLSGLGEPAGRVRGNLPGPPFSAPL